MPKCFAPIVRGAIVLGEICHIRARRKNGPRYDPALSAKQKDDAANLILLCPTCHSMIDKDEDTFSPEYLESIKKFQEENSILEISPEVSKQAVLLFDHFCGTGKVSAKAGRGAAAVAIGGDNHAPINIHTAPPKTGSQKKDYPANSIGADANLKNYIDYLCDLYVKYSSLEYDENKSWAMLGRHIKSKFRLKARTRNHLSRERFDDLVTYLVDVKLAKTWVGRKHIRNGTRLCRTFDEYRFGEM